MIYRLAGACSLLVFALSLVAGIQAQNSFSTTVARALTAMAGTYVVGLIVGLMAQKMLNEPNEPKKEIEVKGKKPQPKAANDR